MAAIAAQKLGALASRTSESISVTASKVHDDNKEAFGKLDNACCGGGVSHFFEALWGSIMDVVASSFFPYLLVTYALNIPPFAYGVASAVSYECNSRWLIFNAFLTAMHMVAAVYTVYRIRTGRRRGTRLPPSEDGIRVTAGDATTPYVRAGVGGEPDSWDRIRIVLCYDMAMAVYYILCLVWAIWEGIGTVRIIDGEVDADCGRWVLLSVICGYLYMGLGLVAFTLSLCFLRFNTLNQPSIINTTNNKAVLAMDDNGGISLA